MKIKDHRRNKGFTIIETSMVLAIAGLIMAVVFLAIPQLQRSARDSQRKDLVSRMKSEIETYASNNQGTYPLNTSGGTCDGTYTTANWDDFYCRYVNNQFNDKDPTTGNSIFGTTPHSASPVSCGVSSGTCTATLPSSGVAKVIYSAKCSGATAVNSGGAPATTTHDYAIVIGLDRANTYYCVDNI